MNYSRGGQHPQYGKINNPKLDRGDFIFVPTEAPREEVEKETESSSKTDAEKLVLEEELKRLRAEMEKTSRAVRELQTKETQEKQLAYAPKGTKGLLEQLKNGQGPFVIDDFEDGNLWSQRFEEKWIKVTKGPSKLKLSPDRTQGANRTRSSMKIEYVLGVKSACRVQIGRFGTERTQKIEQGDWAAYDMSRFRKISFFLKGAQGKTSLSRPNKIFVTLMSYDKRIKSQYGKFVQYYNKTEIIPTVEWKRIEVPFDDFIPSLWTKNNVTDYSLNPDFCQILSIYFLFSSFKGEGGRPGSNTIWIDEISLE